MTPGWDEVVNGHFDEKITTVAGDGTVGFSGDGGPATSAKLNNPENVFAHKGTGAIYIADAALYLMSTKPELGIRDPYELNEEQYKAALELLRGQRKIVSRYWHDPFIQIDDFVNEGVVASSSWPFMVNLLVRQGKPIASTVPKEGATGWADTTMVHVDAPHPICAQRWLEHSLDPKLPGDLAAYFGSVPAVPAACEGNELLGKHGCKINGIDNFDKVRFWRTPRSLCDSQRSCVPYYRWVTDYIAVLGGR